MSASLEEALRLARKAAYGENDGNLEFTRSKHGSRKRDAEKYGNGVAIVSKGGHGKLGTGFFDEEPSSEAVFWKSKFEEVQRLRLEAEEDIKNTTRIHKEREDCLENYVKLLQQKINNLEKGGAKLSSSNTNEANKEYKELENVVQNQKNLLEFYELLTGASIRQSSQSKDGTMVCTLKNTLERKATRFTLSPASNGELDFTPEANIEMLPDFLQGEIQFAKEMAPAMFANALSQLYDSIDGDNEDTENDDGMV